MVHYLILKDGYLIYAYMDYKFTSLIQSYHMRIHNHIIILLDIPINDSIQL